MASSVSESFRTFFVKETIIVEGGDRTMFGAIVRVSG